MTETGEQDIDGNKEGQNDEHYGLHFRFWPWREVLSSGDLKNYTSVLHVLSSVDCYVICTISIVLFFRRKSLFIIAHFTSVKRNKSIKKNGPFCFDKFLSKY